MKNGICRVCRHESVLRIAEVADVVAEWNNGEPPDGKPKAPKTFIASYPWRLARLPADPERGFGWVAGLVEAYVCEGCGYTELYTKQPKSIEVDGTYVRRITPSKPGPYR